MSVMSITYRIVMLQYSEVTFDYLTDENKFSTSFHYHSATHYDFSRVAWMASDFHQQNRKGAFSRCTSFIEITSVKYRNIAQRVKFDLVVAPLC